VCERVGDGSYGSTAAWSCVRRRVIPGGSSLLSDTVVFMSLLGIYCGIIRELAITAILGVVVIILTNIILLPLLVSFVSFSDKYKAKFVGKENRSDAFWESIAHCSTPKVAYTILAVTAVLFVLGLLQSQKMKIGDLHAGAPALHEESRYNQDTFLITDKYAISVDYISILVETSPEACTSYEAMTAIDELQWKMTNVEGVQSAVSLAASG